MKATNLGKETLQMYKVSRKILKKALKRLQDKYVVDCEVMEPEDKVDLLETINDIMNILLFAEEI